MRPTTEPAATPSKTRFQPDGFTPEEVEAYHQHRARLLAAGESRIVAHYWAWWLAISHTTALQPLIFSTVGQSDGLSDLDREHMQRYGRVFYAKQHTGG